MRRYGMLVLVVVLLAGCGAEPASTSVPPTDTSIPPTDASIPPTDTSIPPTETPAPTPTVAGPSAEVQAYAGRIGKEMETLSASLRDLSELLLAFDPTDNDWITAAAQEVAAIQLVHKAVVEMDVPLEMAAIHVVVLDATGDCNASMDKLVEGVDNRDSDAIEAAGELMQSCTAKLQQAASLTNEYMDQFEP